MLLIRHLEAVLSPGQESKGMDILIEGAVINGFLSEEQVRPFFAAVENLPRPLQTGTVG